MNEETLVRKIAEYNPRDALEKRNVIQELIQHFVLASLSKARFFDVAGFHGGTCLRILEGTPRFSEDLDFVLKTADPVFRWDNYVDRISRDWSSAGLSFSFHDRSKAESAVKKAFLKTDSIGTILRLQLGQGDDPRKIFRVKIEVDTNPPAGSEFETRYITFPHPAALSAQTLASSFANKSHALLCRGYTKGRDWYDFIWYAERRTSMNWNLLESAIHQNGPWQGEAFPVDRNWYVLHLGQAIDRIDWKEAVQDLRRFLPHREQGGLDLWSASFFHDRLRRWAKRA